MPLTDTQLAYTAGIVDGEGCISVHRQKRSHTIRVHVTNTNADLIARLLDWFGGHVYASIRKNPRHKDAFVWEVSALQAGIFLQQILPFLFLKRAQAEVVLELQATKIRKGRTPVSAEVLSQRFQFARAISVLNLKGQLQCH